MSLAAVIMMIITIITVWGGLAVSIVLLNVLPVPYDEDNNTSEDAEPRPVASAETTQ